MKDLVLFLAKQLVNHPDAVEVKEIQGDTASVLELKVAREDIGRVIGKQDVPPSRFDHPECRRVPHQPQGHPRDHRRALTCRPRAGMHGARRDRRRGRRARHAHGLRGQLRLWPYQPGARRSPRAAPSSSKRDGTWLAATIVALAPHGRGMLLTLAGIAVAIPRPRSPACGCSSARPTSRRPTGEFYHHELLGFAVVTTDGRTIGDRGTFAAG
jgi:hypothetical protein